jgi:uncharacterized protein
MDATSSAANPYHNTRMKAPSSVPNPAILAIFQDAKSGKWESVFAALLMGEDTFALEAVRYVSATSKWSLLHQAAYWGNENAIKCCVKLGAFTDALNVKEQTPRQVAKEKGHVNAAELLRLAEEGGKDNYAPSPDMIFNRPASCLWDACKEAFAPFELRVAYAGGQR